MNHQVVPAEKNGLAQFFCRPASSRQQPNSSRKDDWRLGVKWLTMMSIHRTVERRGTRPRYESAGYSLALQAVNATHLCFQIFKFWMSSLVDSINVLCPQDYSQSKKEERKSLFLPTSSAREISSY